MKQNIQELKEKFSNIKNRGYIKSINNYKNGSGITLEHCLESTGGDICIPDFKGIEIKSISFYQKANLNLFSSTPDGKFILPTQWLSENYGYPDRDYKNINVLKVKVDTTLSKIGTGYYFSLVINRKKRKVELHIYDRNKKFINNYIYWDFDSIEEKLVRKLSILAIFKNRKKEYDGYKYYSYVDMKLYRLKGFDVFLYLLEKNVIKISFNTGVYKSGYKKGKFHDHGTSFVIEINDVEKLFVEI